MLFLGFVHAEIEGHKQFRKKKSNGGLFENSGDYFAAVVLEVLEVL